MKMPLRQLILLLLVGGVLLFSRELTETEGKCKLAELLMLASKVDYIGKIAQPLFPEFGIHYYERVFRHVLEDGFVEIRVDLCRTADIPCYTFIKNRKGQFAIAHDEKLVVSGVYFYPLFYFEHQFDAIPETMLSTATYTLYDFTWNWRPCENFVIELPAEEDEGNAVIHCFLIDKSTGGIVQRHSYNSSLQLIGGQIFDHVDFSPDWSKFPDCFATPKSISSKVLWEEGFIRLIKTQESEGDGDKSYMDINR